jgi:hypothetical protein
MRLHHILLIILAIIAAPFLIAAALANPKGK